MTREEIGQKLDALAREYDDTDGPEIPEEIYELARRLREMGTESNGPGMKPGPLLWSQF